MVGRSNEANFFALIKTNCPLIELQKLFPDEIESGVFATLSSSPLLVARDKNGWTGLHWAASKGYDKIAKWLVSRGADMTRRDLLQATPMMLAVDNHHWSTVIGMAEEWFTDENDAADYNHALRLAVLHAKNSAAEVLLQHGANPDARFMGASCLHTAIQRDNTALVRLLLAYDATLTLKDKYGRDPKELAVSLNRKNCLDIIEKSLTLNPPNQLNALSLTTASIFPEDIQSFLQRMHLDSANLFDAVITPNGLTLDKNASIHLCEAEKAQLLPNHLVNSLLKHYSRSEVAIAAVPECLRCAKTGVIFKNPVVAADGQTYEKNLIEKYLCRNENFTPTGVLQKNENGERIPLYPNCFVADLIMEYYFINGEEEKKNNRRIRLTNQCFFFQEISSEKVITEYTRVLATHITREAQKRSEQMNQTQGFLRLPKK